MNEVKLTYEKLDPSIPDPKYQTEGAAGFDLCAVMREDSGEPIESVNIHPSQTLKFGTGIKFTIPDGYELQIRPRSRMSLLGLVAHFGTVDADYRGQVMVTLCNVGPYSHSIENGDRIAQAVLAPVTRAVLTEGTVAVDTERGEGGFGSTGK